MKPKEMQNYLKRLFNPEKVCYTCRHFQRDRDGCEDCKKNYWAIGLSDLDCCVLYNETKRTKRIH